MLTTPATKFFFLFFFYWSPASAYFSYLFARFRLRFWKALLKNALDTGGQDNISIVLCATLPLNSTKCRVGLKGKIKKFLAKL